MYYLTAKLKNPGLYEIYNSNDMNYGARARREHYGPKDINYAGPGL